MTENRSWAWPALAFAVIAVALGVIAFVVTATHPASLTATGTVTIAQVQDSTCAGTYHGLTNGAQVTITGPDGVILGIGHLGVATVTQDLKSGLGNKLCQWAFRVEHIESGKPIYGLTIASRPTLHLPADKLKAPINLTEV